MLFALLLIPAMRAKAQAVAIQASQTTLCAGGTAVLEAGGGANGTSSVSYTWSPLLDLALVPGSNKKAAVAPLTSRTYTVTATDANGTKTTATVKLEVMQNCCQKDYAPTIVELDDEYDNIPSVISAACPNGCPVYKPDPFAAYPPGTYFHVRSGGSLHLIDAAFHLPLGTVLLMDAGQEIIIDDATLDLQGATITAACNEMWGRLRLPGTSHGLTITASNLRSRIMHSLEGIVIEDTAPATSGPTTGQPTFQLDNADFLHNYRSLTIDRENGSAFATDRVKRCLFDSDPTQMKSPYNGNGTSATYSQEHVRLTGNLANMSFLGNTFRHAVFGVALVKPVANPKTPAATLTSCRFEDFYLAGVFYKDAANATPTAGRQLAVVNSTFEFFTQAAAPATTQISNTRSVNSGFLPAGTGGIVAKYMPVDVSQSLFEQADATPYAKFGYAAFRTPQTGIAAQGVRALLSNSFLRLHVGVAHEMRDGTTDAEVKGNLFSECEKGYEFVPSNAASLSIAGTAWLDCNTFARGVSSTARAGVSYGIYNDAAAFAKVAKPASAPSTAVPYLRNRFDDAGAGASNFQAIYNANSGYQLYYYTYTDVKSWYSPLVNAYVDLDAPQSTNHNPNFECAPAYPSAGIPRAASSKNAADHTPQLEQNAPNPVQGYTTFRYQVPATAQQAEIVIRRATDGYELKRVPLLLKASQQETNLLAFPAGVYFYSLLVDGVPAATRRLEVR
jgi:hypothetical protein